MTMEPHVSDHEASDIAESVFIKDVITSETHHVASDKPASKKQRKWAFWTRQEEESFFSALRQVGKDFEKITFLVESKNKDQVRHYYYRLVTRINKLVGPELALDASNCKETNAAMLRWWSLLENHSCKASKLHLKPRRFKMFKEKLEQELLKDRKTNIRKQLIQGEMSSLTLSNAVSSQGRSCTQDAHINLVDFQTTQNLSSRKGYSLRRNASRCLDRKGDLSAVKQARQRRRPGTTSTAAYKRWEKAAIAGVSLVADAAEHLEQTSLDKLVDAVQHMKRNKSLEPVARDIPPVPRFHQATVSAKLKLQLFPINEIIRRALEMDNHNPHLELTLRSGKKISSVLEHISRKWGSCSIASGELMLLPYYAQSSNLENCQKWTQDSVLSAADVYAALGSPSAFRLRYGWFMSAPQEPLPTDAAQRSNMTGEEDKGSHKNAAVSVSEWADNLTNVSVSDLLSDVSHNAVSPPRPLCCQSQQIPFICDSFDAAIAAHITKHLGNDAAQTTVESSIWDAEETCDAFTFRKFNAEKTHTSKESCNQDTAVRIVPSGTTIEKLPEAEEPMEDNPAEAESMDECQSDMNPESGSTKDLHALTDIYWPDSLGPLEVNVPLCKYQNHDLILSDSLGGLSRILTSSLDGFQNCSFFGLEQREPPVGDCAIADHKSSS